MNKLKKGFTLSEVLITLTVIGVLAAMLIPVIQNLMPDSNKVMFRKAHNSLKQAISDLLADDDNYPSGTFIETAAGVMTATPCTINGTTVNVDCAFHNPYTYNGTIPVAEQATSGKFCYLLADALETKGTVSCGLPPAIGTFNTNDGMSWSVYIPSNANQFPVNSTDYSTLITVDVNGPDKGKNCGDGAFSNPTVAACASTESPDVYQFGVRYDGRINIPATEVYATEALTHPNNNKKCNPNIANDCTK